MQSRKILSSLLLLAMMSGVCACGSAGTQENAETSALAETSATAETTAETGLTSVLANLPDKDYNGYTFTIYDRNTEYSSSWYSRDVFAEELTGEPINDAVFQRNSLLEESFNIKLKEVGGKAPASTVKSFVVAGDDSCDFLQDGFTPTGSIASGGYLYDVSKISTLKLSEEWWDQAILEDFAVRGKKFYLTGDISTMDNIGTWCMLFNKSLIKDYKLDDVYTLVNNGTWTLDKMYTMSKKVASDLNGNGQMDDTDRWGLVSERYNFYVLWNGSGEKLVTVDKDGKLSLTMYTDRSVNVAEDALTFHRDKTCVIEAQNITVSTVSVWTYQKQIFSENRALFYITSMNTIVEMRDYDADFGIIPIPKYSEDQKQYSNTYSAYNFVICSVPAIASDPERTGVIVEAMAEISKYTLTPAYYDVTLKTKSVRDEESAGMIDLILATRNYDLGNVYNFGGTFGLFTTLDTEGGNFASSYASLETSAKAAMEEFYNSFAE